MRLPAQSELNTQRPLGAILICALHKSTWPREHGVKTQPLLCSGFALAQDCIFPEKEGEKICFLPIEPSVYRVGISFY